MSSQPNTTTIPFSIAHKQQPVRLLELPPSILALIASSTPPILTIKAAPSTSTTATAADHAVLCTADKTFALRQVHSSNTTFLVTATPQGVAATSTVTSYLELLPTSPDAKLLLQPHLLPYPPSTAASQKKQPRSALIKDVPVSEAEFVAAWNELAAFEHGGCCYLPSPAALLEAVKEVVASVAAEGVKLDSPFRVETVVAAVDEDAGIPDALVAAVVGGICDKVSGSKWVLSKEKCVKAVGLWVLAAWAAKGGGDMLYVAFMKLWKTAVPDGCAGLCRLEVLKGWHVLPTPNTIRYVPSGENAKAAALAAAKNKWHARLGAGKK